MKILLILAFFSISFKTYSFSWDKGWVNKSNHYESLMKLTQILNNTKIGRTIVTKARAKYKRNLIHLLAIGDLSLTDTSLVRSFFPNSTKVTFEEHSKITISRNLNLKDAVLDLAHELTHYTYRKVFNPYLYNYSIEEYINRTIKDQGGEVDAFLMECRVRRELFGAKSLLENQCGSILKNHQLSRSIAIKLFFQMGEYYSQFIQLADTFDLDFSLVSSKSHRFISSAFNVPYPLAAALEYRAINRKICNTNNKRILSFKKEMRKPASTNRRAPAGSVILALESQYRKRCI